MTYTTVLTIFGRAYGEAAPKGSLTFLVRAYGDGFGGCIDGGTGGTFTPLELGKVGVLDFDTGVGGLSI